MGLAEKIYNKSPFFLQTLFLNGKAFELYLERYGPKFWDLFEEFQKNQWLPEADLKNYQDEQLRVLIRHAYNKVPYYRRRMSELRLTPKDIKKFSDLHKLPILKKIDIKENFRDLICPSYKGFFLRHGHTSGTTGSPMDVCYNIRACVVHHVADWRQKSWAGLKYGEPYASIQGRTTVPIERDKPPFWRKNYINNQLFLSSFHLKEKNIPYYFDKMAKDGIQFIEGYPSTIYILALFCRKKGQKFPMKAVLTSSETIFDYQREAIEDAFCCRVFDFYGMAERVLFSTECDHHTGPHVNMDYGIMELIDSKNNWVEPGRLGRVIATGLHNFAMPLIRYQTNDSSALQLEPCPCGRGFPLMERVTTKDESIISLPDGRLISPSVLTHPFKPLHNILESQIIQEQRDRLLILIVRGPMYGPNDEVALINGFRNRLGDSVDVNVKYVDYIHRTNGNKFKWVISKIKPEF
jgi:phenylacetate-CoA ligase